MHKLLTGFFSFALALAFPVNLESAQLLIKKDARVLQNKPTVFLSFEKAGARKQVHASESDQGIWLRLHNNTPWAINVSTQSFNLLAKAPLRLKDGRSVLALREGVEIMLSHGVEVVDRYESRKMPDGGIHINESVNVPNPPVGYNRGSDVSSSSWLPSGHSVIFSVPKEHLAKRLAIFVSFRYEWETTEGDDGSNEPEHRVYFRAADLPGNLTEK